MADASFERLSAQDSSFVHAEGSGTHMHVSAVAVFDPAVPDGSFDFERARGYVDSRLAFVPRYRKRLTFTPLQRHPVWVDDERFDIAHHVRHVSLPRPGGDAQLKDLAGRLLSQPLDRERPLWEMWFVEGLEDGRFAAVVKVHHCLVDGVTGVGLMHALLGMAPVDDFELTPPFRPRAAPGALELVLQDASRVVETSAGAVRTLADALLSPSRAASGLADASRALWDVLRDGAHLPPPTPLNRRIGTQRRVDWRSFDLQEVREIKKRFDGTVNDVVLAVVTGALRRRLRARRVKVDEQRMRVVMPVDMRGDVDTSSDGNHVSALFLELPLKARSARRRFEAIRRETRRVKASKTAEGIDLLHRTLDWSGIDLLSWAGTRLIYALRPHNLIVTNIPGPQFPLYLLGARLRSLVPGLPLFENQGLGVAAMSYDGRLHLGLVADWDVVPDLDGLSHDVEAAFAELQQAARR